MKSRHQDAERELEEAFGPGEGPVRVAEAPYRLSPLGAHTDHQEGLTLGFALDRKLSVRFRRASGARLELVSRDFEGRVDLDLAAVPSAQGDWGDHVRGVTLEFSRRYPRPLLARGVEGIVTGELPPGGVSSSAALGIAVLLALADVNEVHLDPREAMGMIVEAERSYSGVAVGLLDPAVILFGRERALVYLDCREGKPRVHAVPKRTPEFELLLVDSGLRRDLRTSPYNARVQECRLAARQAGAAGDAPVLRDVDAEAFRRARSGVDPVAARRADHFYAENKRVKLALQALAACDLVAFGALMNASAESLTRLYDCGTPETRDLVQLLQRAPGVFGASYAGAGFGGLVQALALPGTVERLEHSVLGPYRERHPDPGAAARVFTVNTGGRARVV